MSETEQAIDIRTLAMQMGAYQGKTRSISQRASAPVTAHELYATLLDADRHGALTGAPTSILPRVGGPLSLQGGKASGYITELLDDRHIVFAWRSNDPRWPENHYSTATFMLRPEGTGTTVVFFQQGVPEELADEIAAGWQESYWDRLSSLA